MHIARILTRLNLGGPARQVLASDPRLIERGFRVTVLAGEPEPGEGDLCSELQKRGVPVVRVPGLQRAIAPRQDRRALRFLREQLAELQPDLVHTHTSKAGFLGRRAAQALGFPTVHTFHGHVLMGHFAPWRVRLLAALERRLARQTTCLVAVSHATARELASFGIAPEADFEVVYGGAELQALAAAAGPAGAGPTGRPGGLRATLGLDGEAFLIGVLGRLAPIKNPAGALQAFRLAAERVPNGHLVFVGDGPERSVLEREREKLGHDLRARVHLAGAWENMEAVLPELNLLLSASRHEGLPIAFVEAGAARVPAVATPVGGVGEFVEHGVTGWLGGHPAELAAGLIELAASPAQRLALGSAAQELALRRHSADALTQRLIQVYRSPKLAQGGSAR